MTSFLRQFCWLCLFSVGLSLLLPHLVLADETELQITRMDGSQLAGTLLAWSDDELTLSVNDQKVSIATSQLSRVRWQHSSVQKNPEALFVELVDGTRLPMQAFRAQAGRATVTTPLAEQPLTLSTQQIRFVQLSADASWQELAAQALESDLLMISKKKSKAFDFLTGVLGEVTEEQVQFTWDGETIPPIKRSKVLALAYYHTREPNFRKPNCWLNLQNGGRLPVAQISWADGMAMVRTSSDLAFSIPAKSLSDADYSQGKLAYLSDLKPVQQEWTPRISLPVAAKLIRQHGLPRRDQSFTGSALTLFWPADEGGASTGNLKTYSKGLALRSRTELRYRLPAGMHRFVSLAGIDPETANQGNVHLEILADRRSVWRGEIDGGSAPTSIDVALGDARELRIVVDYGTNLDFGDRLHLVEARVSQ